jgi:hypothetical protein
VKACSRRIVIGLADLLPSGQRLNRPPVFPAGRPSPGITAYGRLLAAISGQFPRGICAG